MKKNIIELVKIEAEEGYWLTQKNLDNDAERIFSDCLYLGANDSEDNWVEWSEEEKDKMTDLIKE